MASNSAVPLIGFYASVRKHSLDSYLKRHPNPILLYLATIATDSDKHYFTTETATVAELRKSRGTMAGELGMQQRAAIVRKSARNAFGSQISIGRGEENDIVVEEPTVSKAHAYLEQMGKDWTLSDLDSANGTFVGGTRLLPHASVAIEDEVVVSLGGCEMRFLLAGSFYSYVRGILESSAGEK